MSVAGQLTILLTLKDRAPFTQRWLEYATAAPLPFRILMADGSHDDAAASLVAGMAGSGLDLELVRYPVDHTYQDYYRKLADALARVTTPLVVLADNDDLFIRTGLDRAVQFLAEHPSYVACGGQCAVFWITSGSAVIGQDATYGEAVEWKVSSQFSSDAADTAERRLRERCMGANDVFYAVHRTDLLRSHFAKLRDCNPRDLFLVEQLIMFLTAISGKTRQLDTLYIARQQNSPVSSGGAHQDRFGNWYDRMLVPTWSEDFTRFVDCSAEALALADGISIDAARRAVVASYKMSVAPSLLADLVEEPTVSFLMPSVLQVVRHLVNLPPTSSARRVAQRWYRRARWLSHDFVHGTEFRARRAREAAREFAPVRTFLAGDAQSSRTSGT